MEAARSEWKRVVPLLMRQRTIAAIDLGPLADYCQAVAQFRAAVEHVREHGYTTTTDKGNEIVHPMAAMLSRASERISRGAQHFGLSPATRARVEADASDEAEEKPRATEERPRLRIAQ